MASVTAYSHLQVAATLDRIPVRGLWDGDDAIAIEQGTDVGVLLVGADGSSIFSQSANKSARITLRLQHTSATHRQLLQKWKQQRAGRMIGFSFDLKDKGSGMGGTADRCFIMQGPATQAGTNAVAQVWVLITGEYEPEVTLAL